jgi:hypothetical protein
MPSLPDPKQQTDIPDGAWALKLLMRPVFGLALWSWLVIVGGIAVAAYYGLLV